MDRFSVIFASVNFNRRAFHKEKSIAMRKFRSFAQKVGLT